MVPDIVTDSITANFHSRYHHAPPPAPLALLHGFLQLLMMLVGTPLYRLRARKGPVYAKRFSHWYGNIPLTSRPSGTYHIVVYCHNVGEVRTAVPLIRLLRHRHPTWTLTILVKAIAAYELASTLLPEAAAVYFAPHDAPLLVDRLLQRLSPDALVTLEGDLRTHLVTCAKQRGIATLFLGAEISPGEQKRHKNPMLYRYLLACTDVLAMRTDEDIAYLRNIGAPSNRLMRCGNLRYDVQSLREQGMTDPLLQDFLTRWRADGLLLVAGSTYAEEEAIILQALTRTPLRAVIAPRDPKRADDILHTASGYGLSVVLRSSIHHDTPAQPQILVLDTMGELCTMYGAGDIAFVGGSIVPRGGHNIIEAAAHGIPLLFGQSTFTNTEIADRLLEHGGARCVNTTTEFIDALQALIADPETVRSAGTNNQQIVEELSGATETCLRLIEELLYDRDEAHSLPAYE